MSEINFYSECDENNAIADNVFITQVEQMYKQIPIVIAGPIFGAFITAALLSEYISFQNIVIWLSLVVCSYAFFIIPWLKYKQHGVTQENAQRLAKTFTAYGWVAALSWGSVSFFLFSYDSMQAQILLTMSAIVGVSAITVSTIIYKPLFYTIIAMLVPLILRFIYVGDENHYIIALACAGYSVMLFLLHASLNKSMLQSLRLQFVNERLASDLNIQKIRADKANADKSKFLAAVSHDLRQPLHAHSLFFGELQNRLQGQTGYRELTTKLETSLESMGELFNALLELSKLEAGAINPDIQSFYLKDLILPIEQEYIVKSKNRGLDFRAVKSSCVIRSDKILLSRIIRNLLENALIHSSKGKVLLGCRRKGNMLSIQILDNGEGISVDDQKYIFDEYYQVGKKGKNKSIGFGLGLSVVKQQCELLNHAINLSSTPGKGTTFSIEVPISSEEFVQQEKTSLEGIGSDDLQDVNIAVIDDDALIRDAIKGVLSLWGCHVITGASANEIQQQLTDNIMPDIILSDYHLGDDNTGFEAIEQLRNVAGNNISAAIITGDTSTIDAKVLKDKNYLLLQKPVNTAKLRTLLRFLKMQN